MSNRVKKLLIILIVITCISMCVNIAYALSKRIEKPILVEKYEKIGVVETNNHELRLRYIKDHYDKRELVGVKLEGLDGTYFPDHPRNNWMFNGSVTSLHDQGRFYTLCDYSVIIYFSDFFISKMDDEGKLLLEKATLIFDDESSMDVDLGQILFVLDEDDQTIVRDGASGSDTTYEGRLKTDGRIYITSVDLSSCEPHKDEVNISFKVDGKRVYDYEELVAIDEPIEVKRRIEVIYDSVRGDINQQWRFASMCPEIHYEKDKAEVFKVYYEFNSGQMSMESVEAYVENWRNND